jgi:uncharacterized protein YjgD (DUF1641 family)
MARPIALEFSPRDPTAELRSKLENAPAEHAEALLAAYEVLQAMHDQGVLDILRGALDARDELIESAVTTMNTPESIRAIRNLVFCGRILASIEPEWLKRIFQAVPGVAQATSERDKPLGLWGLWRKLRSKDSLRGMAAAVDFLEAFGRHLHSLEAAPRSQEKN